MPKEGRPCLLIVNRSPDEKQKYKEAYEKFAAWDGCDWVDIDGNALDCKVIKWAYAPKKG